MKTIEPAYVIGPDYGEGRSRLGLNSDALAQQVTAQLDGWADLVKTATMLRAWNPPSGTYDSGESVRNILAGADPVQEAERGEAAAARGNVLGRAVALMEHANRQHSAAVVGWLDSNAEALCGKIQKRLEAIVSEAAKLAGQLGNVQTSEDIATAESADAWSRFQVLAVEFSGWRAARGNLTGRRVGYGDWPESDLFADYEAAWPDFYHPTEGVETQAGHTFVIPASRAPWEGYPPAALLRHIVDNELALWAPTAAQLDARQRELHEAARVKKQQLVRRMFSERLAGVQLSKAYPAF